MTLLAQSLAERGLRIAQIVYPDAGLPATAAGVDIVQRDITRVGGRAGALREPLAIWTALTRSRPSAVVHRSAGAEAGVIALWCRATRRRFVYSASSTVDFTFETLRHRPRDVRLHRLGLRLAYAVVVQSDEQAALAATAEVAPERIHVIRSIAQPADPAGIREAFVWAGGGASYKRPGAFLDLAAALPDARFVMVLAGRSDSEQAVSEDDLAERASGLPNVELTRTLSRDELLGRLSRAVAIVNTSEIEGMPNTFLEAWARGVPALSLTVDPDGLIASHDLGIAANGSWDAFVAGARRLWAGRSEQRSAPAATRAYVAAHHSPAAVTARWLEVFG